MDLESCEEVTKFFRTGKDLDAQIALGFRLLDADCPLYFPRKEAYLLEWWFGKVGTAGSTAQPFWDLFFAVWPRVEPKLQKFVYHRQKFLEQLRLQFALLTDELAESGLVGSIFRCLDLVEESGIWLRGPIDVMLALVSEYLRIVIARGGLSEDTWDLHIVNVFNAAVYGLPNYRKISTLFYQDVLAQLLEVVSIDRAGPKLRELLLRILRDVAFSAAAIKEDAETPFGRVIKTMQASDSVSHNSAAICTVATVAIEKFSKGAQRPLCGALVEKLLDVFPQSAAQIIDVAYKYNVMVSRDILKQTLKASIDLPSENVDWALVTAIMDNDIDSVLPEIEMVFDKLHPANETTLKFAEMIMTGYVRIRDVSGFFDQWRRALTSDDAACVAFWGHSRIVDSLARVLADGLSLPQLSSLLATLLPLLQDLEKPTPKTLAAEVVFPMLTGAVAPLVLSTAEFPESLVGQLRELLSAVPDSDTHADNAYYWRLQYVLLSVHRDVVKEYTKDSTAANDNLVALVRLATAKKSAFWDNKAAAFFGLQVLLRVIEFNGLDDDDTAAVAKRIVDVAAKSAKPWSRGDYDSIDKKTLGSALVVSIIHRWLLVVEHKFGAAEKEAVAAALWSFGQSGADELVAEWQTVVASPVFHEQSGLAALVLSRLVAKLQELLGLDPTATKIPAGHGYKGSLDDNELCAVVFGALLAIPLELMTRATREKLLNMAVFADTQFSATANKLVCRTLAKQLTAVASMTAQVQEEPGLVVELFASLKSPSELAELEAVTVELAHQVFQHDVGPANNRPVQDFGQRLVESTLGLVGKKAKKAGTVGLQRLLGLAVRFYAGHTKDAQFADELKTTAGKLRQAVLANLVAAVEADQGPETFLPLARALENLVEVDRTGLDAATVKSFLGLVPAIVQRAHARPASSGYAAAGVVCFKIYTMMHTLETVQDARTALAVFAAVYAAAPSTDERSKCCDDLRALLATAAEDVFLATTDVLVGTCFPPQPSVGSAYYQALECCYSVAPKDQTAFLTKQVDLVVSMALVHLGEITHSGVFLGILSLFETLFRDRAAVVSAYAFQQFFSMLIVATSQSGPAFVDSFDPERIFNQINAVISLVLLHHHSKLHGRHHLFVRLLENLLYCFTKNRVRPFEDDNSRLRNAFVEQPQDKIKLKAIFWKRPSWIVNEKGERPCAVACAHTYARLLSNFCEPGASGGAARLGKRTANGVALSSVAGMSRRALSRHLPYLITEYCYANLHFSFDSDVRAALVAGFHTVMDNVGAGEFQVVNAMVDGPGRALFKVMYDDYNKFGKWTET
ncbi:Urb2/Npa2 family-domain-containing protein [Dipodascopsis tothii]|uniref:Urb2/Npa2 family-domain-containing protein n=1 Tax=Dipodascopsis tothii TaxID=44089 RepID=UPI0034CEE21D